MLYTVFLLSLSYCEIDFSMRNNMYSMKTFVNNRLDIVIILLLISLYILSYGLEEENVNWSQYFFVKDIISRIHSIVMFFIFTFSNYFWYIFTLFTLIEVFMILAKLLKGDNVKEDCENLTKSFLRNLVYFLAHIILLGLNEKFSILNESIRYLYLAQILYSVISFIPNISVHDDITTQDLQEMLEDFKKVYAESAKTFIQFKYCDNYILASKAIIIITSLILYIFNINLRYLDTVIFTNYGISRI